MFYYGYAEFSLKKVPDGPVLPWAAVLQTILVDYMELISLGTLQVIFFELHFLLKIKLTRKTKCPPTLLLSTCGVPAWQWCVLGEITVQTWTT